MSTDRIRFVTAPYGLAPLTDFTRTAVAGADGLYSLRGGDDVRLFVIDAAIYLPTYKPELTAEHLGRVGAANVDDVAVQLVVNARDGETTVNLAAPILTNRATGESVQVLLDEATWPLRQPLN